MVEFLDDDNAPGIGREGDGSQVVLEKGQPDMYCFALEVWWNGNIYGGIEPHGDIFHQNRSGFSRCHIEELHLIGLTQGIGTRVVVPLEREW